MHIVFTVAGRIDTKTPGKKKQDVSKEMMKPQD